LHGRAHAPPSYSAVKAGFLESEAKDSPMNTPASAPDTMPPHELPPPGKDEVPEGSNATIHHPDDKAEQHPAREERKPRGPYVTGNT
jgi:hypothetical protein